MFKRLFLVAVCAMLATVSLASEPFAGAPAHLMRMADISATHIVFTYEGDLWLVDDDGGIPRRLTNHPGTEQYAKFSPDGQWLAFTGQYDGRGDVYLMPTQGGEPRRLTFHPGYDQVLDWHPDGEHVLFRSRRVDPNGNTDFFLVHRDGGLPVKVDVDRGALGSFSADGTKLAYNRIPRESRTWKRYEGGMAQEIWVADFTSGEIKKATTWTGTDNFPMWFGEKIYFSSDREDGTLNLFSMDPFTMLAVEPRNLTNFKDYDVKYPSPGPGRIVFQYQESLHVLDVETGQVTAVDIDLRSDRTAMRTELVSINPRRGSFGLCPAGEVLLVEARGELVTVPVEDGVDKNLTAASGSREKNGVWSPSGEQIVFVSDKTGEEQLYLMPAGGGDWRQLTEGTYGMILPAVWSPDSEWILFGDKFMRLNMVNVKSGKVTVIDQGEYDDAWERWGILDYVWSPDSRWIAYTKNTANMHEIITLYDRDKGDKVEVTDAMFSSWSPSFDPDGRYLWFLSNRTFQPTMGRIDQNHIFLDCARPYMVLLQDDMRSPFDAAAGEVEAAEEDEDAAIEIDVDGIADRTIAVAGVDADNWFRLEATSSGCLLLRRDEPVFIKYQNVDDRTTDTDLTLVKYSIEDEETSDLGDGVTNYHLSADGEKMVVRQGSQYTVADAGAKIADGDKVSLSGVRLRVNRQEEYRQIFDEAWRVQRDWFYDAGMHGEDWDAVHAKYVKFVPWCGHRSDLRYLIGEMISELNIGHTYVYGGDYQGGGSRIGTGLLGCDLVLDSDRDRYRIENILPGWDWNARLVSPLAAPGVGVVEGEYLMAIDGVELTGSMNPWSALVDKAGRVVELTLSEKGKEADRVVKVETIRSERGLRYRGWIEANRAKVAELSGGRIGYLHIPNMGEAGLIEFGSYWYAQTNLDAIVIDERYNGGGFVGDMIIDRLEREMWSITIPREGKAGRNPERVMHGPTVILINEDTGSNGEFFAQAIKDKGLAKVMGMRTWGGSIGIEPHQDLVDGGVTTPPQFGLYGLKNADWLIEGWGVDPDQEVQNMPASVVAGEDTQLETAVEYLLGELERGGDRWTIPGTPDYPDKSKPRMSGVNR